MTLGSGAGALTVQSDSNQVDNAIPGVTLNLLTANPSQPVTVTVASNTQAAAQDINGFVSAYNDVLQSIDSQSTFDPTTGTAGLLLGNSSSAGIEQQLRGVLGNVVQGVNANLNNLSALGISTGSNGQLTVDQSQLNAVLAGQVPGVSFNDVQRLFGFTATSTNPGIQFVTVGTNTLPSTTVPYQVNVTQAAAQARITATNALAASTTIDGTDDTFSISVDGQSIGPLTLAHGTYTPQQLAQEVQGEINGSSAADGRQVAVSVSGSRLVVTSASFGRASQATIGTGNALTALGFAGNEAATGQDVAGTFTVNGVVETAVGSGQFLTGASTNANTAGLVVRSTLSAAQIPTGGAVSSLNVTQGLASSLNTALTSLLDPVSGELETLNNGFTQSIATIQSSITQENAYIAEKQQSLQTQFAALEATVSQLQTIGSFLSAQFSSTNSVKQSGIPQPTETSTSPSSSSPSSSSTS